MPYVIADPCIGVKDSSCVPVCPVDCIYEGTEMLYIHPDECIDCGLCESVCPVEAIYHTDLLPGHFAEFIAVNREYFGEAVTGLGSPEGAAKCGPSGTDHPLVQSLVSGRQMNGPT